MSSLKQRTVASFPPASPGDGGRGTIRNSTSKYSSFMNEATLGLEWAFVSLGSAVKRVGIYEQTLPSGSDRRCAMETQTRSESTDPSLSLPRKTVVSAGTFEKTSQRLENGLLSLAVPTSPIQAFTGQIFTNDSITELL